MWRIKLCLIATQSSAHNRHPASATPTSKSPCFAGNHKNNTIPLHKIAIANRQAHRTTPRVKHKKQQRGASVEFMKCEKKNVKIESVEEGIANNWN
jgi:hypothetical protein